MKKEIINGLIKVANNLDLLDYKEEANIVDRVAKKIVVSANPEVYSFTLDQASTIRVTGDYAKDIKNYKSLVNSYHQLLDDKKHSEAKTMKAYLDTFIQDVKKAPLTKYSIEERIAFLSQAQRILNDATFPDVNDFLGNNKTKSLNEYLVNHKIVDYDGTLNEKITDRATFNQKWNQFLNDPVVKKIREEYPDYCKRQLGLTYKILTAKLPYNYD